MKSIITIIIVSVSLFIGGCVDSDTYFKRGASQLKHQGYTDIESTGINLFSCGCSDGELSIGFKCKDRFGGTVTGYICAGAMKGTTIRFD